MITNKLSNQEFNKILSQIFHLEEIDKIRKTIFELLYYKPAIPINGITPTINSKSTGINSTYRGFEIEVTALVEFGIVIKFKKNKSILNSYFYNSASSLCTYIIKCFEKEYYRNCFINYKQSGRPVKVLTSIEEFHLKNTLNSDWYKQKKLSPMMIIAEENITRYEIQFQFNSQCFQRLNNQLTLKGNWEDLCWQFDKKFV